MFFAVERVQNNGIIKILGSALRCALFCVILKFTDIVYVWGPIDHSHINYYKI